jgi:hypothetical protein
VKNRTRAKHCHVPTSLSFELHITICKGLFATAYAQVSIEIKITPRGNLNLSATLPAIQRPAHRYGGIILLLIFNWYVGTNISCVALVRYTTELGADACEGALVFGSRRGKATPICWSRVLGHVGYVLLLTVSLVAVFSVESVSQQAYMFLGKVSGVKANRRLKPTGMGH